jgi:D-apionolactonase
MVVPAGAECHQGLRLTASGRAVRAPAAGGADDAVTVTPDVAGRVPPLGVGASLHPPACPPPELPAGFETVLVELAGDGGRWPALLHAAARQADALGAALDVRLVAADDEAVEHGVAALADLPVVRVGAFDPDNHVSTPTLWRALRASALRHGLRVQLVGGTRAHFTELNRQIEQVPADVPALTFSITPQMHATEVPHIVDSLGVQRTVAENALRLARGRPVFVGPVTLARRFNAVATTPAPGPAVDALRAVDPLQPTGFTGAWTVGSVASLATVGVAGLCYFELCGPRGIVGPDGVPTPAGRVLGGFAELRGRPVLRCDAPAEVPVVAVAAVDGTVELVVGNLSAEPRTVTVRGPGSVHRELDLDGWSATRTRLDAAAG